MPCAVNVGSLVFFLALPISMIISFLLIGALRKVHVALSHKDPTSNRMQKYCKTSRIFEERELRENMCNQKITFGVACSSTIIIKRLYNYPCISREIAYYLKFGKFYTHEKNTCRV